MKRRSFLSKLVQIVLFSFSAKLISAKGKIEENDANVEISLSDKKNAKSIQNGQAVNIKYGKEKISLIIWNQEFETVRVFSGKCTHKGCILGLKKDILECPCHGARFDKNGVPQKGPAKEPLKEYAVSRDGNKLTVWFNRKLRADSLEVKGSK